MPEEAVMKIFDEDYNLRINSTQGQERLERVAAFIDQKMREVAANYVNLSAKHVAVLAALNIAEEYFTLLEQQGADMPARGGVVSGGDLALLRKKIEAVIEA